MFLTSEEKKDPWDLAQKVLPGGVNASARLKTIYGKPLYIVSGVGPYIIDEKGNKYIDLNMSYGASLLGYRDPTMVTVLKEAIEKGILCGHEVINSISLSKKISQILKSAEMTRFCITGTEATWHTIRLANAYTQKNVVVKFEGHFHGYNNYLGYSSWPPFRKKINPNQITPYPETSGLPKANSQNIIILPFNNFDVLDELKNYSKNISSIILEPVNYNSGTIIPLPGYLQKLRQVTQDLGILLIFDEILSGFRTGIECIQGFYGIEPDITVLGKALGGGMPLSAITGRKEIIGEFAPTGKVLHSGTYIAHPTAIMAAEAFLHIASQRQFYSALLSNCEYFYNKLKELFFDAKIDVKVQSLGARFSLLFGISQDTCITNYQELNGVNKGLEDKFYKKSLDEGVYFNPGWHHGISAAHTTEVIDEIISRLENVIYKIKKSE